MSVPLTCLVAFAVWTLLLVIAGVGGYRVLSVLTGSASVTAFSADTDHGGPGWYRRATRAHLNCVENLPVFGAVVLAGAMAQVSGPAVDGLAVTYLAARIVQSTVHVISIAPVAVHIRFSFFSIQIVCLLAYAGFVLVQGWSGAP